MELRDRIRMIMERENLGPAAFADSIGILQSTLSHILKGRNNPSLDVIMKIHQKYNYINLEWLLYERGEFSGTSSQTDLGFSPSLFEENTKKTSEEPGTTENRREMPLETVKNTPKEIVKQEIRYIEKPSRKITEIRIFFDDNTYQIFRGEK